MKKTIFYISFCITILILYGVGVNTLDSNAVMDLENTFNQQQAIQVDLASRSLEEQFVWYTRNVSRVVTDLSVAVEFLSFYDVSGKRLLYSARSMNQVSLEALSTRLENIVSSLPQNDILMWGFVGQDQLIFVPAVNTSENQSRRYEAKLLQWFETYQTELDNGLYVTPIDATPDEQVLGLLHPIVSLDGELRGVLGAVMTLETLIEQFIEPVRSGQFGAAWLQDMRGIVIFDHEVEIIGESVYDLHADFPEILVLDERFLTEPDGISEYSFTVQRGGEIRRKLMAWATATLGNQQMTVALSAPDTEISALLESSRQTSLFMGVLLLVLLGGTGIIFTTVQQTELRRLVAERTRELQSEQQHLTAEIGERKRVELALRASETNFRQLAENIREVFFIIDMQTHRIVYVSPSYQEIWQSDESMVGQTLFDLISCIHPQDRDTFREHIQSFLGEPTEFSTEIQIICGDSEVRWIRWRTFPVIEDNGVNRIICTAEDITAQKQARDVAISIEIERKRAQLLANFVQDAFHEFRTPLSIINTSAYLIEKLSDADRRRKHLNYIREESDNIMNLVEQLVMMARLDVEEVFRRDMIHVDSLLRNLQVESAPEIEASGLAVTWDLQIPNHYVRGDQEQLHRAIGNVLKNAIKYSDEGDSIYIRTKQEDRFVVIEIVDTGIGIEEEQINHVFERFYRVDKAHSTRGFGLGLPIAHHIIERHHGAITASSIVGVGSTLRIMLPIGTQRAPELS